MEERGGRCASHDLAVGPDGLCVLCRRSFSSGAANGGDGPRVRPWVLRVAGLVLVVTVFGYGGTVLFLRVPPSADAENVARANEATEALVGHGSPIQAPPASAPRAPAPGSAHAVPFSIAETPTFAPRVGRSNDVDAGVERPGGSKSSSSALRGSNPARSDEELRAALRRVSVTMYSTEWCPVCTRARAWLRTNNVSFEERDVDRSESARRVQLSLNPKGGVPTIDIDGEVMIGFGAEHLQAALRRAAERRARKF